MLIQSSRHSKDDLAAWERTVELARIHAQLRGYRKRLMRSRDALLSFVSSGQCYAGVSWGKDSVVLAELLHELAPTVPIVWLIVMPNENPDCFLVRDEFLRRRPGLRYEQFTWHNQRDAAGRLVDAPYEQVYAEIIARHGRRYISGVRAEESHVRKMRMMHWGESTKNTCAPIGWWSSWDVFAFLVERDLPIHPAYACTLDGHLDPGRIRVASLGGKRGDGMGRREWEERYYGEELRAIARGG